MKSNENKSEVALLRQRIEQEIEAMQRGLSGLAAGVARHQFIHTRMERVGEVQDELAARVGAQEAMQFVCLTYVNAMDVE